MRGTMAWSRFVPRRKSFSSRASSPPSKQLAFQRQSLRNVRAKSSDSRRYLVSADARKADTQNKTPKASALGVLFFLRRRYSQPTRRTLPHQTVTALNASSVNQSD